MASSALRRALSLQAEACATFGSPFCAALLNQLLSDLDQSDQLERLLAPWKGASVRTLIMDAVPIRLLGALHDLAISGDVPEVTAAYPARDRPGDASAAWSALVRGMANQEGRLTAFMAHEPQTNEVLRSACLLPGFLTVAAQTGLDLRCFEVGASAGLNQFWDLYRYDLGVHSWGSANATLRLATDWRGPPPPLETRVTVRGREACDRMPVNLGDGPSRRRLKAYVWADQTARLERLEAAIAGVLGAGVQVTAEDAISWTARNAGPREGAASVLYHSVFWQYLPASGRGDLAAAIRALGARATKKAPFAWLRMEPALLDMSKVELRLTPWPGGEERLLAEVHPHGAWVEWWG